MSTNAENPEYRSEALLLLKAKCAAMAASMNTPEAKEAAESAFNAGPEVFRNRSLKQSSSDDDAGSQVSASSLY